MRNPNFFELPRPARLAAFIRLALTVAVVAPLLVSCGKDDADTEKPVITVVQPALDHADAAPGDTLELQGLYSDNKELLNARIEIHSAAGHSHRVSGPNSVWEWVKVYPIGGMNDSVIESLLIPSSIDTGEYHIVFEATDRSGNQAVEVIKELHIDE